MPERFRHAHRDIRMPREALPPPPEPLGLALDRLEPPPPPDPHLLMSPDELESALDCADMLDGELPRWHRGHGDADPQAPSILGDEFERALEAAKSEAADYRARRFTDEGEEEDEDEYEDEE